MTLSIKTQADFDALPKAFADYTEVNLDNGDTVIYIARDIPNACFVAWGSSQPRVVARESSQPRVVARESSQPRVVARGSSQPRVEAWESSQPRVVAWGSSQPRVVAWGSSQPRVVAWESSQPRVVARESSQPRVEAWESSQPRVVAWGSSAWILEGSVKIEASFHDNASVQVLNDLIALTLFGFSVAIAKTKKGIVKKSRNATIVIAKMEKDWLKGQGVTVKGGKVILFKRVSIDFKTQEKTSNETLWKPGSVLIHSAWNPSSAECGDGKYHACSRPFFCDEFRSDANDRYIAIEIAAKDLHHWPAPQYPHKTAFRKGKVLYECDWMGEKLK